MSESECLAILAIERAAARADGVSPLDDQVRLDLQFASSGPARLDGVENRQPQHLVARESGSNTIVGYAHLTSTEGIVSAHVMVAPAHQRHGVGTALIRRLQREAGSQPLRVWAHGDEEAAQFLSGRLGFARVRDLWQMRRDLNRPLPDPTYPVDVIVRTFEPGRDDDAWVRLNAAAFRDHPEQGQVGLPELRQRMRQPWLDPAGFFLAERGEQLVGFHWTKVHPDVGDAAAFGEVYAVGVHPCAQGLGLGKALTLTGLHHLQRLGLASVMLYVDADNAAAVAVYRKLGFEVAVIDVMYEWRR
ncbi:MAG: mycothiol synthase [Nocardioidaceae bacterium]